jgi:serine/threonine-protein kinase
MQPPDHVVLVPAEYLSPERITGQRASPRSDIYGLGVLAFELVTGSPPFRGPDAESTKRLHMTAPVPRLPDEAAWLQPWINRCMGKDPQSRFGTMAQVREALLDVNRTRVTVRDAAGTVSMRPPVDEPPVVQGKLEAEAKQLGPYALEKLLGEGGMGQVWLAKHTRLDRLVAIKLLRPELSRVEQQVQRFVQEARAVNRVNHPHIVEIHDFVEERDLGRVWCVMEYLKGTTLKTVGREGPISIARSVGIARQVCDALEAAHKVGVVHRDIKPDNIFLVEGKGSDFVKVLDFGVAKLREDRPGSTHTDTGEIVGTPAYMSPEQALGQDVDARSDLYSLGTLLYVLLAGRFPFDGVTAGQMVANIVAKPPIPLPAVARSGEPISPALVEVVLKALMKDPAKRYRSMAELSQALADFETTGPQTVSTVGAEDVIFEVDDAGPPDEATKVVPPPVSVLRRRKGKGPLWLFALMMAGSAAFAAYRFAPQLLSHRSDAVAPRVEVQAAGEVAPTPAPPPAAAAGLPALPPPPVVVIDPEPMPDKTAPAGVKKPVVVKKRHGGR